MHIPLTSATKRFSLLVENATADHKQSTTATTTCGLLAGSPVGNRSQATRTETPPARRKRVAFALQPSHSRASSPNTHSSDDTGVTVVGHAASGATLAVMPGAAFMVVEKGVLAAVMSTDFAMDTRSSNRPASPRMALTFGISSPEGTVVIACEQSLQRCRKSADQLEVMFHRVVAVYNYSSLENGIITPPTCNVISVCSSA